ncbi:ubiquitin-2 like Rad60 SUMO-like-domain-containing protein [Thelonectria olida]|uniref:Ubiquitin-2 like Rad60 SUMO-like-domain-containing protein n=1 Tax=Thelonectria olida TaxID=1576542 RepID=A0A9P9AV35_9HYPO|nr:ubiquitin-2 like Rad60 SUMO-like-domain-containing protein [Thelonectria olida]
MPEDFLASPPKKKKLPFKPTALRRHPVAKSAPVHDGEGSDNDDGLDLFRRSKEMAPIVAADRERRLKRKQKQRELEEQREEEQRGVASGKRPLEAEQPDAPSSSGKPRSDDAETQDAEIVEATDQPTTQKEEDRASELVTPPPSKRSRTGTESSRKPSETIEEATEEVAEPSPSVRRIKHSYRAPESPVRPSPSQGPPLRRSSRNHQSPVKPESSQKQSFNPSQAPVISLDSDSDSDIDAKPSPAILSHNSSGSSAVEILGPSSPQPSAPSVPEAEDDEFAEYVRRAREQRAKDEALLRSSSNGSLTKEATEIFISSVIPNTKPIRVKSLFNQPLRLIRDTWLATQRKHNIPVPTEHPDDVILTWRRKKVYNYSTLQSLGIRPGGDGRLVVDGRLVPESFAGFNESRNRVNLEVWTHELFQEMEADEDLRRRRDAGELEEEEEEPEEEEPAPVTKLKVILKSKDLEEVKLSVRPETTIETLITGFRTQRDIPASKDVSLWFDGERLEEHMTMDDCEIDDMDTIEVHMK